MLSILKTLSLFSGSRDPRGPHLPSPFVRKFHISLHTLPDDERSISRIVAEKHFYSRQDELKNSMNTTESTNTNIFKNSIFVKSNIKLFVEFTNGNLSRKFVDHGTVSFQPRERASALSQLCQTASRSLGQIFFYSDLKFTTIHSLK